MDEKILKSLHQVLEIQGSSGNWNYDPYMHGMYNGMELMMSLIEKREPMFREGPEQWLCDKHLDIPAESEPKED